MRLESLCLRGPLILAPMAGVTDVAFRIQCSRYGSALNLTDMVSVNSIVRHTPKALDLARTSEDEGPVAIQLFGSVDAPFADAIRILENDYPETIRPSMFDLNIGCPVRKVVKKGAGCALLRHPDRITSIISQMKGATDLPISAKMRLGPEPGGSEYLRIAKAVEDGGADLLTIHARHCGQSYSGPADWEKIREIKDAVGIPVAGNGDARDGPSVRRMLDETGCDFVMVGRAALGNPHIFRVMGRYLDTGEAVEPMDKIALFGEYFELAKRYGIAAGNVKRQALYFSRGMEASRRCRDEIMGLSAPEDILAALRKWG